MMLRAFFLILFYLFIYFAAKPEVVKSISCLVSGPPWAGFQGMVYVTIVIAVNTPLACNAFLTYIQSLTEASCDEISAACKP